MLGIAPDNRGLLPDADVARLRAFGEAIRARYGNNLALKHAPTDANSASALDGDADTFWSAPAGAHHAALDVAFEKPVTFDRALTMEWLNDGQHIEKYAIEAWAGGNWKRVAEGHAIGHKKIDVFEAVTATRVRLQILSSTSEAHIREFQLFNTGSGH
jgi:alpha-L-fucosidase